MLSEQILLPKLSIHDQQTLCQLYLTTLYQHARIVSGDNKSIAETYGEILFPSVSKLLANIPMTNQDSFVDLGSGLGKVVLQVFLQTEVREAHGIELIPALHHQAEMAANKLKQDLPEFFLHERQLIFTLGDFLKYSYASATIALISSPCFTPDMLNKLSNIINLTPSIHTVISLRPLIHLTRIKFKKVIRIEGSWDTSLCYLYN